MNFSWNSTGITLAPENSAYARLVLEVFSNCTGITDFSFNININYEGGSTPVQTGGLEPLNTPPINAVDGGLSIDSIFVHGSDFIIDFRENDTLVFQSFSLNYSIVVHVVQGEMNGTDGGLQVRGDGGYLRFTSTNNSIVTVSALLDNKPEGIVQVSGCSYAVSGEAQWTLNIQDANQIWIGWSFGIPMWMPVNLMLGTFGIMLFIMVPIITVWKLQKKDYDWLLWAFLLFLIAIGLIIGWLWM
jgi:hypothetical protein